VLSCTTLVSFATTYLCSSAPLQNYCGPQAFRAGSFTPQYLINTNLQCASEAIENGRRQKPARRSPLSRMLQPDASRSAYAQAVEAYGGSLHWHDEDGNCLYVEIPCPHLFECTLDKLQSYYAACILSMPVHPVFMTLADVGP
jgi:hypothetical protein